MTGGAPLAEWRFSNRRSGPIQIGGHIICNDGEAAHAMALEGMGIVLVQILPKHAVSAAPINAVYLRGHNRVPRVRAFIDFLGNRFASERPR